MHRQRLPTGRVATTHNDRATGCPECEEVHCVQAVPTVDDLEDLRLETDVGVIVLLAG